MSKDFRGAMSNYSMQFIKSKVLVCLAVATFFCMCSLPVLRLVKLFLLLLSFVLLLCYHLYGE